MATHFSTLAWRIPWREEPGRLQSMASVHGDYSRKESDTTEQLHFTSLLVQYLLLPLGIFICFHLSSHLKNGKNKISFLEVYYSVQIRWHI